jgi:hypothetical protein
VAVEDAYGIGVSGVCQHTSELLPKLAKRSQESNEYEVMFLKGQD